MATDTKIQWQRAETAVSKHADELRTHTTHHALRAWAEALDLTEPAGQWIKVKSELRKQLDIGRWVRTGNSPQCDRRHSM